MTQEITKCEIAGVGLQPIASVASPCGDSRFGQPARLSSYRPPATYPRPDTNNESSPQSLTPNIHVAQQTSVPSSLPSPTANGNTMSADQTSNHPTDGGSSPPGVSTSRQIRCFEASADIIGLDGSSQEFSICLWLNMDTIYSGPCTDIYSRNFDCRVTAEQFLARLLPLNEKSPIAFEIQEVRLRMGPSMAGFTGSDRDLNQHQRSIRPGDHQPKLRDLVIKELNLGGEQGVGVKISYPFGISLEANKKRRREITLPESSIGLARKTITVENVNRNQFQWRYGISSQAEFHSQPLLTRCASFENHKANFLYGSGMIPCSMRIEVAVICRLPSPLLSQRFRSNDKTYPCRNIRFKLQVDIFPTATKLFSFPRTDCSGKHLDLGSYLFVKKNGLLCLDIDHHKTHMTMSDSELFGNGGCDVRMSNWNVTKVGSGELRVGEICNDGVVCSEHGLEFQLKR